MSNVHRFKPRPKAPPPRKRLPWASAGWLPWLLILAASVVLAALGMGQSGAGLGALAVVLAGAWLQQRG